MGGAPWGRGWGRLLCLGQAGGGPRAAARAGGWAASREPGSRPREGRGVGGSCVLVFTAAPVGTVLRRELAEVWVEVGSVHQRWAGPGPSLAITSRLSLRERERKGRRGEWAGGPCRPHLPLPPLPAGRPPPDSRGASAGGPVLCLARQTAADPCLPALAFLPSALSGRGDTAVSRLPEVRAWGVLDRGLGAGRGLFLAEILCEHPAPGSVCSRPGRQEAAGRLR